MSGHGLGGANLQAILHVVAKGQLDGLHFGYVAKPRRGGVGIQIVDLLGIHAAMLHRHLHGASRTGAVGRGSAEVVSVGARTITDQLGNDRCTATFGVFKLLDHHHTGALTHHESIAILVEGTRSSRRVVVSRAQRPHASEPCESAGKNAGLGTARDHCVGIAELDDPPCLTDRVVRGRTGRDDGHVGTAETELHREDTTADVRNHHRDQEWRNLGPFLDHQLGMLVLQRAKSADATADNRTDPGEVEPLRLAQSGRIVGHAGSGNSKLDVAVGTTRILGVSEKLIRGKVLHLTGDLARIRRRVQVGNAGDPAATFLHAAPGRFGIVAQRTHTAHSRDYNSSLVHHDGAPREGGPA